MFKKVLKIIVEAGELRLPNSILVYMLQRYIRIKRPGITTETLLREGIRWVDRNEAFKLVGQPCSGLLIPYHEVMLRGELRRGEQFYRLRKDVEDEYGKYAQLSDSGAHCLVPKTMPPLTKNSTLYVIEGEWKAMSLCEAGYHAIAVGGITSCFDKQSTQLVDRFAEQIATGLVGEVQFIGDCDTALLAQFAPAMMKLAKNLPCPLRLVRLPILGSGKGIDDIRESMPAGFNAFFNSLPRVTVDKSWVPSQLSAVLFRMEVDKFHQISDTTALTTTTARKKMVQLAAGYISGKHESQDFVTEVTTVAVKLFGFKPDEFAVLANAERKKAQDAWAEKKAKRASKEQAKADYKTTSFSSPAKPAPAPAPAVPSLQWSCSCGKLNRIKQRGVVCGSCSVQVDLRKSPAPAPAPTPAPANDPDSQLRALLASRIYIANPEPTKPEPRYFVNDIEICTACNLSSIAAAPKAGKSAASSAMIASTFASDDADCLGFRSKNPDAWAVIHIDTEQSPYDHWKSIANVSRRAGCENNEVPPWVLSYCCAGMTALQLRLSIPILLSDAMAKHGGIHSVIIDGIADCVINVNDDEECNNFIAELHALAIKYNTNVINIIHTNHSDSKKKRGHLGSQLDRKCETNLELDKDGEVSLIYADRNRHAPISKSQGPQFAYDKVHKMHMSVVKPATATSAPRHSSKLDFYISQLHFSVRTYKSSELKALIREQCKVELRTAGTIISELLKLGKLSQKARGTYTYAPNMCDSSTPSSCLPSAHGSEPKNG